MKKLSTLALIFILTSPAAAKKGGFTGGFDGPSSNLMTISQAKTMNDDSYVTLVGNIVQHIKDDHYLFKDATDTITVEIDDDKWRGITVRPEDKVELTGEVEKKWFRETKIEVDKIIIKK